LGNGGTSEPAAPAAPAATDPAPAAPAADDPAPAAQAGAGAAPAQTDPAVQAALGDNTNPRSLTPENSTTIGTGASASPTTAAASPFGIQGPQATTVNADGTSTTASVPQDTLLGNNNQAYTSFETQNENDFANGLRDYNPSLTDAQVAGIMGRANIENPTWDPSTVAKNGMYGQVQLNGAAQNSYADFSINSNDPNVQAGGSYAQGAFVATQIQPGNAYTDPIAVNSLQSTGFNNNPTPANAAMSFDVGYERSGDTTYSSDTGFAAGLNNRSGPNTNNAFTAQQTSANGYYSDMGH
jgi:hypothetical protein